VNGKTGQNVRGELLGWEWEGKGGLGFVLELE
jgi:hypothetical protein